MTLTYLIELKNGKEKRVKTLEKCRALVYKKYKRHAQARVYVLMGTRIIDTFARNDKGYMISLSGYPLYI